MEKQTTITISGETLEKLIALCNAINEEALKDFREADHVRQQTAQWDVCDIVDSLLLEAGLID